jgi:hypothetical protein
MSRLFEQILREANGDPLEPPKVMYPAGRGVSDLKTRISAVYKTKRSGDLLVFFFVSYAPILDQKNKIDEKNTQVDTVLMIDSTKIIKNFIPKSEATTLAKIKSKRPLPPSFDLRNQTTLNVWYSTDPPDLTAYKQVDDNALLKRDDDYEKRLKATANPKDAEKGPGLAHEAADIASDVFGAGAQGSYMGSFKT